MERSSLRKNLATAGLCQNHAFRFLRVPFPLLKDISSADTTEPQRQYEDVNYIICSHGVASKSTYLMKNTIKV